LLLKGIKIIIQISYLLNAQAIYQGLQLKYPDSEPNFQINLPNHVLPS